MACDFPTFSVKLSRGGRSVIEGGIAVETDAAPCSGSFATIMKPAQLNLSEPLERRVAENVKVCHNGLVGGRTERLVHA